MKIPNKQKFQKISKAVSIISNTLVIILLGLGFEENSLILLIARVGISGLMSAIEVFYTDEKTNKNNE